MPLPRARAQELVPGLRALCDESARVLITASLKLEQNGQRPSYRIRNSAQLLARPTALIRAQAHLLWTFSAAAIAAFARTLCSGCPSCKAPTTSNRHSTDRESANPRGINVKNLLHRIRFICEGRAIRKRIRWSSSPRPI
jgi:hypothetical protein